MELGFDLIRENKHFNVIPDLEKGGVTGIFLKVDPATGKREKELQLGINWEDVDLLACSLVDDRAFVGDKQKTLTLHMNEGFMSISLPTPDMVKLSWVARVLQAGDYEGKKKISILLSPVESYRLAKFFERVNMTFFLSKFSINIPR